MAKYLRSIYITLALLSCATVVALTGYVVYAMLLTLTNLPVGESIDGASVILSMICLYGSILQTYWSLRLLYVYENTYN